MKGYIYCCLILCLISSSVQTWSSEWVELDTALTNEKGQPASGSMSVCSVSRLSGHSDENLSRYMSNATCLSSDEQLVSQPMGLFDSVINGISIPVHIVKVGGKIKVLASDKRTFLCGKSTLGKLLKMMGASEHANRLGIVRNAVFLGIYVYTGLEHILYFTSDPLSMYHPLFTMALAASARVLDCECTSNLYNLHNAMGLMAVYHWAHWMGFI